MSFKKVAVAYKKSMKSAIKIPETKNKINPGSMRI